MTILARIILVFALVSIISVPAYAGGEEDADNVSEGLPTIKFKLDENHIVWRPAGFYRLKESFKDDVCHKLEAAFQKPWGVKTPGRTSSDFDIRLILGTEYSVQWTELEHYNKYMPAHRVQIDINNDGKEEIIYRIAYSKSAEFYYPLFWVDVFPVGEKGLTPQREKELRGKVLTEQGWEGHFNGWIYINERTVETALPPGVFDGVYAMTDIAVVESAGYILETQAFFRNKPLDVFVYETYGKRHHKTICHFVSTAQIDKLF